MRNSTFSKSAVSSVLLHSTGALDCGPEIVNSDEILTYMTMMYHTILHVIHNEVIPHEVIPHGVNKQNIHFLDDLIVSIALIKNILKSYGITRNYCIL